MKSRLSILLVAILLVAIACSDSTTGPEGGEQIFTGQVVYQSPNPTYHTFTMTDTSIVRIDIVELVASTDEGILPDELTPSLGFGLGFSVDEQCRYTYRSSVVEGSDFSFQLTPALYCISLVDPGTLTEGMVVDYAVSLKGD
jgi:hypothetical protein